MSKYLIVTNDGFLCSEEFADKPCILVGGNTDIKKALFTTWDGESEIVENSLKIDWDDLSITFAARDGEEELIWMSYRLQRCLTVRDI